MLMAPIVNSTHSRAPILAVSHYDLLGIKTEKSKK